MVKFLVLLMKRTGNFLHGQQLTVPAVALAAIVVVQAFTHKLSLQNLKENGSETLFPYVATAGVFACYLIVLASIDLNKEIASRISALILAPTGRPATQPKPRMSQGVVLGTIFIALVVASEYIVFRAIFPGEPVPKIADREPRLIDLFTNDYPSFFKFKQDDAIKVKGSKAEDKIVSQLYFDVLTKTEFVGFYLPSTDDAATDCRLLASAVPLVINDAIKKLRFSAGNGGERTYLKDVAFSGRVIIYHEDFLSIPERADIIKAFASQKMDVLFRGPDYLMGAVTAWQQRKGKLK